MVSCCLVVMHWSNHIVYSETMRFEHTVQENLASAHKKTKFPRVSYFYPKPLYEHVETDCPILAFEASDCVL